MKEKILAKDFPVVCVGGSAGGLDSYTRLLKQLPADMGVAIVIVNHVRTFATMLHEILPLYTAMPVELITERLLIEPDHVYIIPEQHDLHVLNEEFRLKPVSKPRGWPDVITVFLRSLIKHWDGTLIAVIVSGYDGDGAEAALERFFVFDDLVPLVGSGGANGTAFAPGPGGLEKIGGIHAVGVVAGADDGVKLVDKEDGVLGFHLLNDSLEAVFEHAAIHGARHELGQVEHVELGFVELGRCVFLHDRRCHGFGNGRFADAGFADKNGIVFRSAAHGAKDLFDLAVPADDGVELVLLGQGRKVNGERFEGFARGPVGGGGATAPGRDRVLADALFDELG